MGSGFYAGGIRLIFCLNTLPPETGEYIQYSWIDRENWNDELYWIDDEDERVNT